MVVNKRGQIFSLFMVVFTVFLCGVVIMLYFIEQGNTDSSLVSPAAVLDLRDQLSIFELKEVNLIKGSFSSASGEFGDDSFKSSFSGNFIDGVEADSSMSDFLFNGLFVGGVELRDQDKNRNTLENSVYPQNLISFDGDKMIFGRAKIEKRGHLVAKEITKINFPVYFAFEFEQKYSINKKGEVLKI